MIKKILLNNFRNFSEKLFNFSEKTTVVVGPNASGKTNILEAIYLLSTGKSFKAKIEEEMIAYGEEIGRVKGMLDESRWGIRDGDNAVNPNANTRLPATKLEVVLTRGEIKVGTSPEKIQKAARKRLLLNGVPKRLIDFSGTLKVVMFSPQDLELVTESPSIRRNFLDTVLSQVDREYRRASLSYSKGLRQRNRLLFRIREEGLPRSQLLFWDKLLIKNGDYISSVRENFINFVNDNPTLQGHTFSITYDKSAISEARITQYKNEEVAAATTLVGPHRDDLIFKVKGKGREVKELRELGRYGSRGEQRMGVLWLKLNELSYITERSNPEGYEQVREKPVLLLDDIFSELDHEHREIVMEASKNQQTIITTADEHYIKDFKKLEITNL